jgi:predicted nucleic acid-binding protein
VRLVIADTGPINYLVLIGNIDLLPGLFEKAILPSGVEAELADLDAPASVRNWIAYPPAWLDVQETPARQLEQAS